MGNTQKNTPVDIQVRIDKLLDSDSSTKAFASATIGNAFAVHDIRITEKDDTARVVSSSGRLRPFFSPVWSSP